MESPFLRAVPRKALVRLAAALLPLAGACSTVPYYRYSPSPQDHDLRLADEQDPLARVQVASMGFESVDDEWQMRFRVRLENPIDEAIRLATESLELFDGALNQFGPVLLESRVEGAFTVQPGEARVFDLAFPVPRVEDSLELESLSLRFGVDARGVVYSMSASFERVATSYGAYGGPYPYYGRYYGPYWGPGRFFGGYRYGFWGCY